MKQSTWNIVVFCIVTVITVLVRVETTTGVTDTYGRHFVFPVPNCDVEYKPYLLVTSARKGLTIELIVAGLFTEIVRTNIVQFTRFDLPCRKLKKHGITHSGAISVISSHNVMLHVTYHYDNFMVYPVLSLGWNYTIFLPRLPHQSFIGDTTLAITSVSKQTRVQIRVQPTSSNVRFGGRYYGKEEKLDLVLNDTDVAIVTCFRRMCNLHIQGSQAFFVLIWNTIRRNAQRIFIEQVRPDNTWGETYILPLPDWADDQVRLVINTARGGDSVINFRTLGNQDHISLGSQNQLVTMVTATEYVELSSTTPFHIMFLIRDAGSVNDTLSLISGVPIGQYLPMTCDVIKGQTGVTTIVYEEFVEETFIYANKNYSDVYTNYSTSINVTVVDNAPPDHGTPRLIVPFLKKVLGAYTVYSYSNDADGSEQLISGGSKLQRPYYACAEVNGTAINNTLCLQEILDELSESEDVAPDKDSELFSFIGCPNPGTRHHITWYRGTLKNRGITASVIAVIISIVVAVIGVIGFIIGLVIIDLKDDQRPMRQARVRPIEDEPPPPSEY